MVSRNLQPPALTLPIPANPFTSALRRLSRPLAAALALSIAACGGVEDGVPAGEFTPPVVEFQLVFEDNFDGTELDTSKWNVETGDGCPDLCGWGNNELQSYSSDNIEVSGGTLKLEGRRESDGSYTSARINTRGKFDFRYGRVEVSARIPAGQGTWPAIWLLHSDPSIYGPWPLSGEIDIMEAFNYGVDGNQTTSSTTHYGLPTPPFTGTSSKTDLAVSADLNFHEYALEWERGRIRFFVDGVHFQTQIVDEYWTYYPADDDGFYNEFGAYTLGLDDAPFDQLFHLILNFAIGGNPVGSPDAGTIFPQALEIDYVRVYECANSNPESRRGCGSADPSVPVLEDHDGGPLEGANTAKPYVESVDLFLDGPETITVNVGDRSSSNTLRVDGFTGEGATVTNDPAFADPDEAGNTVWHVAISGNVANVFLASEELADDELLDTGFDFSGKGLGGDPVGEIVFDMRVNSIDEGTTLLVKLDSGFPDLGQVAIPSEELLIGEWKTYSVKFDDLLANPGFLDLGGTGVDLENVVNPFVFEVVGGAADVYLDNIRITNACYVVGACGAAPKTKGIPDFIVFDDAVNVDVWDKGIRASDSGTGFTDYTDGTNPANKVNWAIIDDADPERGQVIDITFNDSSAFGVWFIQSTGAVDLEAFAAGAVVFDIIVDDYGNNTDGMTMKIDCFFSTGCTSGDKNIGVVGDGVWETVVVPVSQLVATGLDLANVDTGIVLFPTSQSGTIRYRLDNIRWIAETDAPTLSQIDLPVTFEDPTVDYTLIDFGGADTGLVDDPLDANNTVASTVKTAGAETFAGTVIGTDAGFATPIPFAPGDTQMSIDVYSPAPGVPVLFKVENADASVFAELVQNTTTQDAWETLTFDFATVGIDTNVEFVRAIVFFDFGQTGNDATYLWDNVRFGAGATLQRIDLPVTFELSNVDYTLIDFSGASTVLGDDPVNLNNRVAITTKTAGAQTFAGTVVGDGSGFANPIPFTATETTLALRVRSPAAGIPVMLKVEAAGGNPFAEVIVNTTAADTWETLEFDFSTVGIDVSQTYIQAVVFFDFGQPGNDAVYHWDELSFGAGGLAQPVSLPVTFDEPNVNYAFIDFAGAGTGLGDDPDDAANRVAVTTKNVGAETFAGTVVGDGSGFPQAIPFTATETTMSLRVRPPAAGIPVMLKVEAAGGNPFAEVIVNTTAVDAWETLVFDFSTVGIDVSQSYIQAVVFFDFGQAGDGATYYWDDLAFGTP